MNQIGFMQGRLSPQVDGKIQAFPWTHWREEFAAAQALRIPLMEWTLDHDRLAENPLMTAEGQAEIKALCARHGVRVGSLTGDIFMQMPFWRVTGAERAQRLREFEQVAGACASVGIRFIVVPLADNGAMTTPGEEAAVVKEFTDRASWLKRRGLAVVFECDYPAAKLADFIARFPAESFGVNYDIGNSAALGYDSAEEIACPNRVAPSVWLSAPLYALPIGVRAVETITASVIVVPLVGNDSRITASNAWSALLRVPHQMIGRIAKLDVDGVYPLEVMADVQFVAHSHASMQLHGLLCDEARRVAHFRLRAGRQFRSIWLPGCQAEAQMLGERDRLFERNEHVDHAVLQHLKRPERDPELLARFAVFKGCRIQH